MKKVGTGFLFLLVLLGSQSVYAQSPAAKVAFAQLDQDRDAILKKVDAVKGLPRINTVYYGSFLLQATSALRNSIAELPTAKKTVLSLSQKSALADLNKAIATFSARISPYNDSIANDARAILAKLDANLPNPGLINALLIKAGNQGKFEVKVDGDLTVYDTASLMIDKSKVYALDKSSARFFLTAEQTAIVNSSEPFQWHKYTLRIPYGSVSGSKKKKKAGKIAEFDFLGCTFPTKPGKVDITTTKTNSGGEVQHKRTRTFLVNSTRENLIEKQCLPKAENGYTVLLETAQLEIESSKGKQKRDWNYQKTNSGGNVCFVVETFYNKGGESGKLEFHLNYDVKKNPTAADNEQVSESVNLDWGQNIEMPLNGTKPEVVFTDYKGDKSTIGKEPAAMEPVVKTTDKKITITMPGVEQMINPMPKP